MRDGRLLVQMPGWLGDSVIATGLLESLARALPGHTIELVGNRVSLAVTAGHPAVAAAHEDGRRRGAAGRLAVARALRQRRYVASLTLGPAWSAAVIARLIGAPRRTGFEGAGRRRLLTDVVRRLPRGQRHLRDEYLDLARAAGIAVAPAAPRVVVDPAAVRRVRSRVGTEMDGEEAIDAGYLVVAPGATYGPAKRWSAPGFAQVARTLALEHGWRVVVVGGEGDRAPAAAVTAALRVAEGPTVVDLAGTTTVQELAAVLAGARLVIANDSGPMHLAAAVGAPLVGLFGSTEPGWTAPLGGIAVTTEPRPACAPCFERTCDVGYVCLTELDPARVVEASERALAAAGTATSEHPSGDG